jgi:hypothetical protein
MMNVENNTHMIQKLFPILSMSWHKKNDPRKIQGAILIKCFKAFCVYGSWFKLVYRYTSYP